MKYRTGVEGVPEVLKETILGGVGLGDTKRGIFIILKLVPLEEVEMHRIIGECFSRPPSRAIRPETHREVFAGPLNRNGSGACPRASGGLSLKWMSKRSRVLN